MLRRKRRRAIMTLHARRSRHEQVRARHHRQAQGGSRADEVRSNAMIKEGQDSLRIRIVNEPDEQVLGDAQLVV